MAKWNDKGLTLLGVLVAILVFATVLMATFSLMARSVREVGRSRENFTATNLAREGLELVQFVRDMNMLSGTTDWTGNVLGGDSLCDGESERQLVVDRHQNLDVRLQVVGGPAATQLWLDTGRYQHDPTSTIVPFHRRLTIDCSRHAAAGDEHIVVTSQVTWDSRGEAHDVTLRTYLYHWYQ